jgi:hypothetical protein
MICHSCKSYGIEAIDVGIPFAYQCLNCGFVGSMKALETQSKASVWPFPCEDNPLTPLTDKQVKEYNAEALKSLGQAPF